MIYANKLTFKEPTASEVPLNESLVKIIKVHHQKSREHLFHMCMIAYGLRKHNLISNRGGRGGNAQGKEYKSEFLTWYEKYKLEDVYGSKSNFTLYAMCGRLLNYVAWQVDKKYINRLPSSMTALYACSKILWEQGDKTDDERRDLFRNALLSPIKDGSEIDNTIINPHATRKEIESWLEKILNKKTVRLNKKNAPNDPRNIFLGQIMVNEELYRFTATGTKSRYLDIDKVNQLVENIESLVNDFNQGKDRFIFLNNLDSIKQEYKSHKVGNFGSKILPSTKVKSK